MAFSQILEFNDTVSVENEGSQVVLHHLQMLSIILLLLQSDRRCLTRPNHEIVLLKLNERMQLGDQPHLDVKCGRIPVHGCG